MARTEWLGVLFLCLLVGLSTALGWLAEAFFEAGGRPAGPLDGEADGG